MPINDIKCLFVEWTNKWLQDLSNINLKCFSLVFKAFKTMNFTLSPEYVMF